MQINGYASVTSTVCVHWTIGPPNKGFFGLFSHQWDTQKSSRLLLSPTPLTRVRSEL